MAQNGISTLSTKQAKQAAKLAAAATRRAARGRRSTLNIGRLPRQYSGNSLGAANSGPLIAGRPWT